MTVLAVSEHSRNSQRVVDLAALGYLPEPVLDPTYGYGGMWTDYRPGRLVTMDINPNRNVDIVGSYHALPFPDGAFGSALFDPPYRLAGTATNRGGIDDRFGIGTYRTPDQIHDDMRVGLTECARVVRRKGYVIVKCQDQVVSGRVVWQTRLMAEHGEALGLRWVDSLHLVGGRAQPSGRRQKHARRNLSTFVVLGKP